MTRRTKKEIDFFEHFCWLKLRRIKVELEMLRELRFADSLLIRTLDMVINDLDDIEYERIRIQ